MGYNARHILKYFQKGVMIPATMSFAGGLWGVLPGGGTLPGEGAFSDGGTLPGGSAFRDGGALRKDFYETVR